MKHVRAAGGVLWREAADGSGEPEVALVHRPRYDDWSLPKGKLEPGELEPACAVREVQEETGFRAVLGRGLGVSRYRVLDGGRDVPKTVRWWALEATGGGFVPHDEVDRLRWLPLRAALHAVTHGHDDDVLARFAARPARTSTVLLVRHGKAGSREQWSGPDEVRPLTEAGRAQAAALARLLPLWAPVAVRTAPADRCRQTVEPAAQELGLPLEVDEGLSETAGLLPARLRELGRSGQTLVVCSQGGSLIGDAVRALADEAGVEIAEPSAPKGSLWSLSFSDGVLVDADRTDVPG